MQNAQEGGSAPPGDGAVAEDIKDKVGGVVTNAKQGVDQVTSSLKAKAVTVADDKKTAAAETIGTVAEALRGAAHTLEEKKVRALGTYAECAAEQLDKVARYLREKDFPSLTRDTETFARRHPEVFLGGAFMAGMLAARLLKSSRPRAGEGAGGAPEYQSENPINPPHFASETSGGE
jgi:hypothetical protein